MDAGGDAEQVFGAHAAIGIAIALKVYPSSGGKGSGTLVASGSVCNGGASGSTTIDSSIQLPRGIARTA